jgi:hypothetical protein
VLKIKNGDGEIFFRQMALIGRSEIHPAGSRAFLAQEDGEFDSAMGH